MSLNWIQCRWNVSKHTLGSISEELLPLRPSRSPPEAGLKVPPRKLDRNHDADELKLILSIAISRNFSYVNELRDILRRRGCSVRIRWLRDDRSQSLPHFVLIKSSPRTTGHALHRSLLLCACSYSTRRRRLQRWRVFRSQQSSFTIYIQGG